MQPLWRSGNGGSWLIGAAWVFGSAPMIFNSFQSDLHTLEERSQSTSKEVVVRICVATVDVATPLYLLISAPSVHATPWDALASRNIPAIDAHAGLQASRMLPQVIIRAIIASILIA